jgi:sec-independent protein translocase protein TatB
VLNIDPAKILVVLLVALVVLGPDKLPKAARQAGRLTSDFRRFRDSLHAEVREAFGDPLSTIPGRGQPFKGQAWMDSVTAEVLSITRPIEGPTPQGGLMAGGATAQVPPAMGRMAEETPQGSGAVTAVAEGELDRGGFDREFN